MIRVTVGDLLATLEGEDPDADAVPVLTGKARLLLTLLGGCGELRGEDLRLTGEETERLRDVYGDELKERIEERPTEVLSLLRAWDGRRQEPEGSRDVHTEHCCRLHGCKYGDEWRHEEKDRCPVTSGRKAQSYPCEDCGN